MHQTAPLAATNIVLTSMTLNYPQKLIISDPIYVNLCTKHDVPQLKL